MLHQLVLHHRGSAIMLYVLASVVLSKFCHVQTWEWEQRHSQKDPHPQMQTLPCAHVRCRGACCSSSLRHQSQRYAETSLHCMYKAISSQTTRLQPRALCPRRTGIDLFNGSGARYRQDGQYMPWVLQSIAPFGPRLARSGINTEHRAHS